MSHECIECGNTVNLSHKDMKEIVGAVRAGKYHSELEYLNENQSCCKHPYYTVK